jgi:hypothetical protein
MGLVVEVRREVDELWHRWVCSAVREWCVESEANCFGAC